MQARSSSPEASHDTQPAAAVASPPPSPCRSTDATADGAAAAAHDAPELDYLRYDANAILDALLRMTTTTTVFRDVRAAPDGVDGAAASSPLPSAATPSPSVVGRSSTPSDGPHDLDATTAAGNAAATGAATAASSTSDTTTGVMAHTPATHPLATPATSPPAAADGYRPRDHHGPGPEGHGSRDAEHEVSVERTGHRRHTSIRVIGQAPNSSTSTSHTLDRAAAATATGLVLSAHATPSATAAGHRSPHAEARQRAEQAAPQPVSAAEVAPPALPTSTALSLDAVGGPRWQHAFAATAQQLLRETQQQVEDLHRYRSRALREAQRADALAAAQQATEAQLTDVVAQRAQEKLAHQRAAQALSHQVLRLEEAVGQLRRSKVDLQRQLEHAQTAAAEAQRVHAAELHRLQEAHARQDEAARAAQQRMEDERAGWVDREAALQRALETRRTHEAQLPHDTDAAATVVVVESPCRVDAATCTSATSNAEAPSPAAKASTDDASSSYERVHRDVLAQQHLRERTMLSELAKVDARLQHETAQRRAAESQVAALLEQNAQLQEALAATLARDTAPERADAVCQTLDAAPEVMDAVARLHQRQEELEADLLAEREQHAAQTQQYAAALAELQREYAQLLEASDELAERLARRASETAGQWTALRRGVVSVVRSAHVHDEDLPPVLGQFAADDASAGGDDVVRAVEELVRLLQAQRDAATSAAQAEMAQRRLSNLEDAVQAAEAQNRERLASLEATQVELHAARRALATWQQRQQYLTERQDSQEAALRAAQAQLQQVASVARRALREYGTSLSAVQRRSDTTPGESPLHENEDEVSQVGGAAALSSASHVSPNVHGAAAAASTPAPDVSTTKSTARHAGPLTADRAADPVLVLPGEEEEEEAEVEEGDVWSRPTSTGALQLRADADGGDGGAAAFTDITADVKSVSRALHKLLTAWRRRQHRLVESHAVLERRLAAMEEGQRTAAERQQASAAHLQQQLRLSRAAEQQHADKADNLQRALDAATQLHATEEVRARQRVAAAEAERDTLQRRLQSTERQLHTAEQALVEADVSRSEHGAALTALQDALGNATDERDRLARHEADLRVHTEDLEGRLEGATACHATLHALLTSCVTSLVRLLVDHQQLRAHYQVLRGVAAHDGMRLAVVEGLLSASSPGGSSDAPPPLRTPPPPAPSLATPARLRSVVYAACAIRRLSWLVTRRDRVLQGDDSSAARPPAAVPASAAFPSLLLALSSPAAVALVEHDAAHDGAAVAASMARLLRRYTTTPSRPATTAAATLRCVRPVVRLPPPSELVKALRDLRHGATTATAVGAPAADVHAQRLLHLLTMAQLDTEAAATRHVWSEMMAAAATGAAAHTRLQQALRVHRAWTHALEQAATPSRSLLLDTADVLPHRLAALLQRQLATSALQARHLTEANAMVQRLVHQNETLVTALERRSGDHEGVVTELEGIRAQLCERRASQEDVAAVQARLVDTHAALLQERKQRRAAEGKLGKLHEERLKWIGAQEAYKREVYALHMELAGANAAAAGRRPGVANASARAMHATDARETTAASALTIETEDRTRMAPEAAARPPSRERRSVTSSDAPDARAAVAFAASEKDWRHNAENTYYEKLLRRETCGDAEGGDAVPHASATSLEYVQRFNLPAPHELCQRASDAHAAAVTWRGGLPPPSSSPSTRVTKPLELFVPNIVRRQEKESREAAGAVQGAFATTASLHVPAPAVMDSAATPPPLAQHPARRPTAPPLSSPPAPQVQLHKDAAVRTRAPQVSGVTMPKDHATNVPAVPPRPLAASPPRSTTSQQPQQLPSPSLSECTASLRSATHHPASASAAAAPAAPSRSTSQRLSYAVSADTPTEAPASSREPSTSLPGRSGDPRQPVCGPLYFTARAAP